MNTPNPHQPSASASGSKTPGTGALWLSILGFCGITAVIGVILGLSDRTRAKKNGQSTKKATSAIVIGMVWLLAILGAGAGIGTSGKSAAPKPNAGTATTATESNDAVPTAVPTPAGLTASQSSAICPFVEDYVRRHPEAGNGISIAVAGQPQMAALTDAVSVGKVAERLPSSLEPSADLDEWFVLAVALQSPEYTSPQFQLIPNDTEATAALVSLWSYCTSR
jgi:hypothetical protein